MSNGLDLHTPESRCPRKDTVSEWYWTVPYNKTFLPLGTMEMHGRTAVCRVPCVQTATCCSSDLRHGTRDSY
jgi:hypothetical protein